MVEENFDDSDKIAKEPCISICNKILAALCVLVFIGLTLGVIATALYFSLSRKSIQRFPKILESGFNVTEYARITNPTQLTYSNVTGNVFAGTNTDGGIHVIFPNKTTIRIIGGLSNPSGVAFYGGSLYVATKDAILKYENIENDLKNIPQPSTLTNELNLGVTLNQQRYIKIHNGRIYVMVGTPCNACVQQAPFGTLKSYNLQGQDGKTYHSGIRYSGGFGWDSKNDDFYFVDEGREWGNIEVPDELNKVPVGSADLNFGFPKCYGKNLIDEEFNTEKSCVGKTPPIVEIGPKSAPRGMTVYNGTLFPPIYQNNIFIAENGVWRSNNKTGFRVSRVILTANETQPYRVFMDGWIEGSIAWGKPSDILQYIDGSLLISDELYGAVFKVFPN